MTTIESWIDTQLELFPGSALAERYNNLSDQVDRVTAAGNEWLVGVLAPLIGKDGFEVASSHIIESARADEMYGPEELSIMLQRAANERGITDVAYVADRTEPANLQKLLEASNQLVVFLVICAESTALEAILERFKSGRSTDFLSDFAAQTVEWAIEFRE